MTTFVKNRAGLVAVTCVAVLAGGTWAAFGASAAEPQTVDAGSVTCTTTSTGYCTVRHALHRVPAAVTATLSGPGDLRRAVPTGIATDQFTSTTFRIRVVTASGAPYARGSVTFSYAAFTGTSAGTGAFTVSTPTLALPTRTLPVRTPTAPPRTTGVPTPPPQTHVPATPTHLPSGPAPALPTPRSSDPAPASHPTVPPTDPTPAGTLPPTPSHSHSGTPRTADPATHGAPTGTTHPGGVAGTGTAAP